MDNRFIVALWGLTVVTSGCAHGADGIKAQSNLPPPRLDLRQRIIDFTADAQTKMWVFEDQLILGERGFTDKLRASLRDAEKKYNQELGGLDDWKKAKREHESKLRTLQQDLRQQARIQREELELQLIRFAKEREDELKKFLNRLESDLKDFEKDPGYSQAQSDLSDSKTELRESIFRFKERMKGLKPKWE